MKQRPEVKSFFFSLFILILSVLIVWNVFSLLFGYFSYSRVTSDNHQIMRIILFGSSENPEGDTVSASITLLDRCGNDFAVIERSWPKEFLAVDFADVDFKGHNYYFPEKIYGTNSVVSRNSFITRKQGTNLVPYYMENGICLFGSDENEQRNLYRLARFAFSPFSFILCGISKRYTVNLSLCSPGIFYGIYVENGQLALKKE